MARTTLFVLTASLLAGTQAGCMLEPGHEQEVALISNSISFAGAVPLSEREVTIEASASPKGPFVEVGSVFSAAAGTPVGTTTLYGYAVDLVIPDELWAETCAGRETFVRAKDGDAVLLTYDSEEVAGVSGAECITSRLDEGAHVVSAAYGCASPYGSPVRLRSPQRGRHSGEFQRDVHIVNPHQAEDYSCAVQIDGDFSVTDPTPTDVSFPLLATVTGSVELLYPRPASGVARTIGLPLLATVGGTLSLESPRPEAAEPLTAIDFGMPALDALGGSLHITFNASGTGFDSLSGLGGLADLPQDLAVTNQRTTDTSYGSLLPNLTSVGGNVELVGGLTCHGILDPLVTVGGSLWVETTTLASGLGSLASVDGDADLRIGLVGGDVPSLTSVGGDLRLRMDNFVLPPGAMHLPALTLVQGTLRIYDSGSSPAAVGAASVEVGGLELDASPGVDELPADVDQFAIEPTGPITIVDNPNITDCEAQSYVDSLSTHTGPVTIGGNGPC